MRASRRDRRVRIRAAAVGGPAAGSPAVGTVALVPPPTGAAPDARRP